MKLRLILSLFALLACNPVAHAELVFDISEEIISSTQTNLLVSISDSVDTDGLTFFLPTSSLGFFLPSDPDIRTGGLFDIYELPNSPSAFWTASGSPSVTNITGDFVGFSGGDNWLFVPLNYVSETPLSASMTVVDRNFDDFSMIAGESYTLPWAVGTADEDSLTVNIVPESTNFTISPSIVNGQFRYQLEQSGNLHSGS